MRILLVNQDWCAKEFREAGHEVKSVGQASHLDISLEVPLVHVSRLMERAFGEEHCDRIVVYDNSSPLLIQGLDEVVVPTLFYSVDTHHHVDLHRYLGHLFDFTLVAQRDYLVAFHEIGAPAGWMPLWASRELDEAPVRDGGAVFVGTLNKKLNPDRVAFFEELKKVAPIDVRSGDFAEIFPRSKVVVNQTVKGDLNFRVFEAMMSGAALLTERSNNGLLELFEDSKHLVLYEKGNVAEAAAKIQELLSDETRTRAIGAAGRAEILAKHRPKHRADFLLGILRDLTKRKSPLRAVSAMLNFVSLGTQLELQESPLAGKAFLAGMRCLERAMEENEMFNETLACSAVYNCLEYEKILRTGGGVRMLGTLAERFPHLKSVRYAQVRSLLNQGDIAQAKRLAVELSHNEPPEAVFTRSEEFIAELIAAVQR